VGTLYTFCPLTLRAKEWLDEHVQDDAQWFGYALIVEHRYAWGLAQGMQDAGLVWNRGTMLRFRRCNEKTNNPSDLRAEAQRLIREGKMPTLKQVLDAIEEVKVHPHYVPIADFDDDAETMLIRNREGGAQ
jgi:hypothetical protein